MRSGASAEQLYDLERQVRALVEECDEARRIIPALNDKVTTLRRALGRARDTFTDTRKAMLMLNRPIVAEAMVIACQDADDILALTAPTNPDEDDA